MAGARNAAADMIMARTKQIVDRILQRSLFLKKETKI